MRRFLTASASALALVIPATADAKPVRRRHIIEYEHAYGDVASAFGRRAPGRNIIRHGLAHGRLTDAAVVRSIGVLRRMFTPPAAPAVTSAAPAAPATASPVSGSPLPSCTWAPESGGDPSAVNPQSGAGGYYQVLPSTWAAYGGTGAPQDAPMSEQTAVAQRIYAVQGPGAWVNCRGGR
jgi:hypothetical protein